MKKLLALILVIAAFFVSGFFTTDYKETTATYVVQPGDTLWNIAGKYFEQEDKERHFGEFQYQIKEANAEKFQNNRNLQPGDVLIIPLNKKVD